MEHRAHTRRKTLKHGSLILKAGGLKVDCIIRDISAGGARIWRPHWISLPPRFELAIPGEMSRAVRLCWQHGQEAGVQFAIVAAGSARRSFGKKEMTAA